MQGSMQGGPVREPQIPRQMNDLDHAIARVEKLIAVLGDRMVSVLPQGPEIQKSRDEKVPEPPCVPLANQLRDLRKRVDMIAASIEGLTAAVEL